MNGPSPHPERGAQPTLSDDVVWLTPWRADDAGILGDLNLDPANARWFDQPAPSPGASARYQHGREVIQRWWAGWAEGPILPFSLRTSPDGDAIGRARPVAASTNSRKHRVRRDRGATRSRLRRSGHPAACPRRSQPVRVPPDRADVRHRERRLPTCCRCGRVHVRGHQSGGRVVRALGRPRRPLARCQRLLDARG